MWHRFWQSLSLSQFVLFFISFIGPHQGPFAQEQLPLGVLQTAEELVGIQSRQFDQLRSQIATNPMILNQLESQTSLKLEPRFTKSLLFNSETKYLNLIQNNNCTLYALIENRLLRSSSGEISNLVVALEKDGELEHALVSRENFLETVYRRECSQNKDLAMLFSNQNIVQTLAGSNFPVPKRQDECSQILDEWNKNPNTPYYCRVAETLKNGLTAKARLTQVTTNQLQERRELQLLSDQFDFYNQNLSHFHRTYLQNACNNLDQPENFCRVYLADDIWNKILNGEKPTWLMGYRCRDVLDKVAVTIDDLRGCAAQFNENPDSCRYTGSLKYPSLFPYFRCDTISRSLNIAKLQTDYHDCPGQIDNEGIINIIRLLNHFSPPEMKSTPETCASSTLVKFAELNINFENESGWPLKICHEDRVTGDEVCHSYVPGHHPESELSETRVVSQILVRTNNIPRNTECRMTDVQAYNPNLLEFKSGCVIIYNRNECTTLHCPKKILYDQKEITSLTYKGQAVFDYFPNSFRNEKFSLSNILKETLKLESKALRNLTELTVFLQQPGNGVVHGIGCAEDLLPERYFRKSLNQCRPMPFIIDGIEVEDVKTHLVVRFPIESIHSPRLMNWNHVFTAITHYKELHPLDAWMMYGLKQ